MYKHKILWVGVASLILSACGGGGGGKGYSSDPGNGYSSYGYSSTPASSMAASSVAASSVASSVAPSSVAASSAASSSSVASTISRMKTNIGSAWTANGSVTVLSVSASSQAMLAQTKTNMTLYVFDNDTPGNSACTSNACLTNWPALLATNTDVATAPLTIITRTDGNKQWALRDKPLYFYAGDTQAGDIAGEGFANSWHVAQTQPTFYNKASLNSADGIYLAASGKVISAVASAGNTVFTTQLQNLDFFSLYTFDNDTDGVSNCTGACLAAWPPLLADANDVAEMPYSIIDRTMGTSPNAKQWAYHGRPLYFYAGDTAAGQTNGKTIPQWHLARPFPPTEVDNTSLSNMLVATGLARSATPVNNVETTSDVAKHNFTLYTFDSDTAGVSNCSGICLTNWQALIAHDGAVAAAPYSLATRTSGEKQWAINGMPLYFYIGDTKSGDTKGEGVGNKWFVARGAPVAVSNTVAHGALFIAHGNLVDATGNPDASHNKFTLYTYDKDPIGSATCNGGCLTVWPALYAPANAIPFGDFTLVTRSTGEKQWAYDGKPLYFYSGDSAAGDVNGEYPDWSIARP